MQSLVFLKRLRLCRHVEDGDVHKTFLFGIFNIFKYLKIKIQIKGAYGPESKKAPSKIVAIERIATMVQLNNTNLRVPFHD
jgi:hypothetical protein